MQAIVLRQQGAPENLRLEDVPDPQPATHEVVIRLKDAALNHRDVWIRSGSGTSAYANLGQERVILGSDGAGEVGAVGSGVERALVSRAGDQPTPSRRVGENRGEGGYPLSQAGHRP